jgi:hypothetical protein
MEDQAEQRLKWWQQLKQHRVAIGVVAIVFVVVIVLIIAGYWLDWTGVNGYNKITVAHTISGINTGTVTRTEEYQPGKGLWDWLQLLIIPAVLAVGGYLFNYTTSRTEREVTTDRQRQEALQTFIDKISELLLHEDLRDPDYKGEARTIIRARTLAVLPELDGKRKGDIIQFLYDAALVIDTNLYGIDLNEAILPYARLHGAFLDVAQFQKANLFTADQSNTILYATDLRGADLREANLKDSNLGAAELAVLIYTELSLPSSS